MACPYFMPTEKFENGSWPHPARLPLGGGWRGHCTAPGHEGETPADDVVEKFCNLGYAEGCAWTPLIRESDAVRFAVAAPTNPSTESASGQSNSPANSLRLHFVCERNHRPVSHGNLEFDLVQSTWLQRHDDARIQKMAECFLESYLKKKP